MEDIKGLTYEELLALHEEYKQSLADTLVSQALFYGPGESIKLDGELGVTLQVLIELRLSLVSKEPTAD